MITFGPGILLMGLNDLHTRLLIQMGYQNETFKINCVAAVVHIVNNSVFVLWLDMGIAGSGLSASLTNLFIKASLISMTRSRKEKAFQ